MNQLKNIDHSEFTKIKGKKYLKSTAATIRATKTILKLFDDFEDEDFLKVINKLTDQLIKDVDKLKNIHQDPAKILDLVLDFIEDIFQTFDIKIFYNLTPNISYQEYAEKPIWEQVINNIFDGKLSNKNPNFIEKDFVKGWNCHHRSILIKKIFDTLKIKWVDCQIRRFQKGHSFLVFEYKNKFQILDIVENWKRLNLKQVNSIWWPKNNEIITKIMDEDSSSVMDFSNVGDFAKHTDRENTKWVRLQIDRIKAEVFWDILKIEITKDQWRKIKNYEIKLNKNTKTYNKQDFILRKMPRVQRALDIVSKKLPDWYIPNGQKN